MNDLYSDKDIRRIDDDVTILKHDFALQRHDMAQVGILVERLDVTIEKLTEVSANVSQLLAVHGSRLEFQERVVEKLQNSSDQYRIETQRSFKDMDERIDEVEEDFRKELKESNETIIKEINSVKRDISDRMNRLEKWMWSVIGGSAVVGFLLSKIGFPTIF